LGRYSNDRIKREEEKKRLVSDSYPPITRLRGERGRGLRLEKGSLVLRRSKKPRLFTKGKILSSHPIVLSITLQPLYVV
jgi:hypothetical protein